MAPNKFATMLHRNTNRLTLVLVYVLLEWILIAIILLNSLFSYLIVKYTDYFGLKRPCVLCSRIDHGKDKRVRKDMICDEHALEISELGFCHSHQKLVKCSQMCKNCLDSSFYKIDNDSRCSCCDEGLEEKFVSPVFIDSRDFHFFDLAKVDEDHEKQSEEGSVEQEKDEVAEEEDLQQLVSVELLMSGDDDEDLENVSESFVAENDQDLVHAPEPETRGDYPETSDSPLTVDTDEVAQAHINNGSDNVSEDSSECTDIILEIENHEEAQKLNSNGLEEESECESELELEQQEVGLSAVAESSDQYTFTVEKLQVTLNEMRAELQKERNDAAEASSQTMAMITKLQEEKAALQLEASKSQTPSDKQIAFVQDAVLPTDESNFEQRQSELDAASTIEKLKIALNEAYAELEQERNDYAEASSQTMAMISKLQEEKATLQLEASQYQRLTEEQIAFDEEAVLLLDEIMRRREKENHELEKQLELYKRRFAEQENITRSGEYHHHHQKNMNLASESVSVCCSSFGDEDSDGVSTDDHQQHVDPINDHPFANSEEDEKLSILERLNELEQKLVEDNDNDNIVEEDGMKCRIEQDQEEEEEEWEDKEFLRMCIKTVKKGDEGMSLVQEILQHLRALRRMEISFS